MQKRQSITATPPPRDAVCRHFEAAAADLVYQSFAPNAAPAPAAAPAGDQSSAGLSFGFGIGERAFANPTTMLRVWSVEAQLQRQQMKGSLCRGG